mgnify:CR=1 FL=1
MREIRFKPTKEAESWLEENRLKIEDCTLRIDWSSGMVTISVLHKDRVFLACQNEFSINDTTNVIDIPGITFPIKFDK